MRDIGVFEGFPEYHTELAKFGAFNDTNGLEDV